MGSFGIGACTGIGIGINHYSHSSLTVLKCNTSLDTARANIPVYFYSKLVPIVALLLLHINLNMSLQNFGNS